MNVGTRLTKTGALVQLNTLAKVVKDFEERFDYKAGIERSKGHHDPVVDVCREAKTLEECIKKAVDGRRRDGKVFSEGSCVRNSSKKKFTIKLIKEKAKFSLAAKRGFEAVYEIVSKNAVWGIGDLSVYNVTARIAAYFNVHPKAFLYLHAGPRKGWRALTGSKKNLKVVPRSDVPKALLKLPMHRIEDLLCEYSEFLHPGLLKR